MLVPSIQQDIVLKGSPLRTFFIEVDELTSWQGILNPIIGFPSGRRTLFLHSICCLALCEPAATELKIKKRSRIAQIFFGVFSRIRFLIYFFLIYLLIFVWSGLYLDRTKGISDGFFFWFCLHIKWFVWFGRLVLNLSYANVFFRTRIGRIWRIF